MTVLFLLAAAALIQVLHGRELAPARSELRRARLQHSELESAILEIRRTRDVGRVRVRALEKDPQTIEAALRDRGYLRPEDIPLRVVQKGS